MRCGLRREIIREEICEMVDAGRLDHVGVVEDGGRSRYGVTP
jgi:hypothetical protein